MVIDNTISRHRKRIDYILVQFSLNNISKIVIWIEKVPRNSYHVIGNGARCKVFQRLLARFRGKEDPNKKNKHAASGSDIIEQLRAEDDLFDVYLANFLGFWPEWSCYNKINSQNYNIVFKESRTLFENKTLDFLGLDLPKITGVLATQFAEVNTRDEFVDLIFRLENGEIHRRNFNFEN